MTEVGDSIKKNVSMQMKELFESKMHTDFIFFLGDEKINAHKAVLAG